jgi:hypothetical protein
LVTEGRVVTNDVVGAVAAALGDGGEERGELVAHHRIAAAGHEGDKTTQWQTCFARGGSGSTPIIRKARAAEQTTV